MARTLGVMITISTYGMWLRGDRRGYVQHGKTLPADARLQAADRARLKHPPLELTSAQQAVAGHAIAVAVHDGIDTPLHALCVEAWHAHLVLGPTTMPVGQVVKTVKEAVRYALQLGRPIWAAGYDKRWCFDEATLLQRVRYVENHNLRRNLPAQPFPHITAPRIS